MVCPELGPCLVELNPRLDGSGLSCKIAPSVDMSQHSCLSELALGHRVSPGIYTKRKEFWFVKCRLEESAQQGFLAEDIPSKLEASLATLESATIFKMPGDYVSTEESMASCIGFFLLISADVLAVQRDYDTWREMERNGSAYVLTTSHEC